VWPFKRSHLTEESFARDPLAHRIFVRSQREHRRRDAADAFWDSAWNSATLRGHAISAIPIYLLCALMWGVVVAIYEEAAEGARGIRDAIRLRRGRRLVRRARRGDAYGRPHDF
jgi:hypothetical protein